MSFDEGQGWSEDRLNRACASAPWFYMTGHLLVYGSLSTKMWRVHRVLQFARREVKIKNVIGPMGALCAASLVLLMFWTVFDPLKWDRHETDPITGEEFGSCQSDSLKIFAPLVALVVLPPTLLTGWMAWKTKDVDQLYTESWWIFVMIAIQCEIILVATPVVVILNDVSTEGRYLLICFMLAGIPLSTLGFIFAPKVLAYYAEQKGVDPTRASAQSHSRGSSQGVRVSGIPTPVNAAQHREAENLAQMTNSGGNGDNDTPSSNNASGGA